MRLIKDAVYLNRGLRGFAGVHARFFVNNFKSKWILKTESHSSSVKRFPCRVLPEVNTKTALSAKHASLIYTADVSFVLRRGDGFESYSAFRPHYAFLFPCSPVLL